MSILDKIITESQHITALKNAWDRNDRVRARKHAEALVRLRPDLACSHYNLGVILLLARDWKQACAAFSCALRIDPGYEKARLGLLAAQRAARSAESTGAPGVGSPPADAARSPTLPSSPSSSVSRVECPAPPGQRGKAKRSAICRLARFGVRIAIVAASFIAGVCFQQWGGLDRTTPVIVDFTRENLVGDDMALEIERRFLGLVDSVRLRLGPSLGRNDRTAKYTVDRKTESVSSGGERPPPSGASQGNLETTPGAAFREPAPDVRRSDSGLPLQESPLANDKGKGRAAQEGSSPGPFPPPRVEGGNETTAPVPEVGPAPESAGTNDPTPPLSGASAKERLESPAVAEATVLPDSRRPPIVAHFSERTIPAPSEPEPDIWEPGGISPKSGRPLYSMAVLRPDPEREYAIVHAYRFDMTALRLEFIPGRDKSKRLPGQMDSRQRQQVAWMFNGGFQYRHGRFGAKLNGNVIHPPRPGIATLLFGPDNTCDIVEWPNPSGNPPQAATYCQNEIPLIMNGLLSPNIGKMWGYTPKEQDPIFTERSALGFTERNHLVFAAGKSVSANTLGKALLQAGVVKAMHLDMNHYNIHLVRANRTGSGHLATENEDKMLSYYPRLYLGPTDRDFFILTMKQESGTFSQ